MITFSDFLKIEQLEKDIKTFLITRCMEYDDAKYNNEGNDYTNVKGFFEKDYDWYEFKGLFIIVYFEEYRTFKTSANQYTYSLPLDILFDSDFKDKMKARFEEEREKERLALIEKRMKQSEEYKKIEEEKKAEEIAKLKELMAKYPDFAKEGI